MKKMSKEGIFLLYFILFYFITTLLRAILAKGFVQQQQTILECKIVCGMKRTLAK